jgi:hypothetical protein
MPTRYEETCKILCEDNSRSLEVDILSFKEEKNLDVSINKSIKMHMKWNGRVYEGKLHGMTFISDGPKGYTYKEGR